MTVREVPILKNKMRLTNSAILMELSGQMRAGLTGTRSVLVVVHWAVHNL